MSLHAYDGNVRVWLEDVQPPLSAGATACGLESAGSRRYRFSARPNSSGTWACPPPRFSAFVDPVFAQKIVQRDQQEGGESTLLWSEVPKTSRSSSIRMNPCTASWAFSVAITLTAAIGVERVPLRLTQRGQSLPHRRRMAF